MKPLFLLFFLLIAFESKATNDTLTRAQVYNFNVGDTFDYRIESQEGTLNGYPGITYDLISFQRIVITAVQYFSVEDSLIVSESVYTTPNPTSLGDTFTYQGNNTLRSGSISTYAVFDSAYNNHCGYSLCSVAIDTAYNQRIVNEAIACDGLGCYADNVTYAVGLGVVAEYSYESDGYSTWSSETDSLIYFSKAGETWGTPATTVMGINTIAPTSLSLFPTINTGQFKIKIANGNSPNYQLVVYDLTGQAVKTATLNNGINNIEMNSTSKGMYLWRVMSEGAILQTGKLIVE